MTGKLTTHVLDTSTGKPASNLKIVLCKRNNESNQYEQLQVFHTNDDGRVRQALLEGSDFTEGQYELTFHVRRYFKSNEMIEPAFFDEIPIRFGVSNASDHYHVPLLLSPYGYTTYRGS